MATADIAATLNQATDKISPNLNGVGHWQGVTVVGGSKSAVNRSVHKYDLTDYAAATITAAELRLDVQQIVGTSGFASELRRVLETFTAAVTWNKRDGSTSWVAGGPSAPESATDTGKVTFNSPTATGVQAIVSGAGVLALVQDAIASRSNLLWLVFQSVAESVETSAIYGGGDAVLRITYTAASSIKKVSGVALASVKKVSGVAIASVKKVSGVTN